MSTVENRSRFVVSVKNNNSLTKYFPYKDTDAASAYFASLAAKKLKPRIERTEDSFHVRISQVGYPRFCKTFKSANEAEIAIKTIESERSRGLFIDYTKSMNTSFAAQVVRYIKEECPKHKSFEIEAYKLNGMLEDAGCARVDIQALIKSDPRLATLKQRKPSGARVRESSDSLHWMNKPFGALEPTDFEGYIQDRLEVVEPATVDREVDLFSAICRVAIDTWRYPVAKSPMDGVRRPRYFNERDRRFHAGEYDRLIAAARLEDRERGIAACLNGLIANIKAEAATKATTYARKAMIKEARAASASSAEKNYRHIPLIEAFIEFQLMTGARRGESMSLTWGRINLEEKTAFLPDTKNGRSRKLPLRAELIDLLRQLPQSDKLDRVFPISTDALRKAWTRVCIGGGLIDLHVHDLRHEAISVVAETGYFSLVDLQAFSGHRDVRMLLRYAHLCARQLAERLDAAFAGGNAHRGRRRLLAGDSLTIAEVVAAQTCQPESVAHEDSPTTDARTKEMASASIPPEVPLASNVIQFPVKRAA